jgi:hypothetical protein
MSPPLMSRRLVSLGLVCALSGPSQAQQFRRLGDPEPVPDAVRFTRPDGDRPLPGLATLLPRGFPIRRSATGILHLVPSTKPRRLWLP